jgi:RimJ/RimL family protein N-acetyltransferase
MRLAGDRDRNIVHIRDDVDDDLARAVEALATRELPFVDPNVEPRHLGEYARLLRTTERSFEMGWVFPRDFRYPHDVELVTSDIDFDQPLPEHFRSIKFTTVAELWRPWCIALAGGEIASIVETVRRGPRGVECGVNTDPRFRGRGLAAAATAGWAHLETRPGRWLFYSTDRANTASQGVARRLGLQYVGAGVALD